MVTPIGRFLSAVRRVEEAHRHLQELAPIPCHLTVERTAVDWDHQKRKSRATIKNAVSYKLSMRLYSFLYSAFCAFWLASSEVIKQQVLFTSEQTEKNKMASVTKEQILSINEAAVPKNTKKCPFKMSHFNFNLIWLLLITWLITWSKEHRTARFPLFIVGICCSIVRNKFWIGWLFSLCGIY